MHTIRKQKERPHVVPGKPYMLFNYPKGGVKNCGLEVDKDSLDEVEGQVEDYGEAGGLSDTHLLTNRIQIWMNISPKRP